MKPCQNRKEGRKDRQEGGGREGRRKEGGVIYNPVTCKLFGDSSHSRGGEAECLSSIVCIVHPECRLGLSAAPQEETKGTKSSSSYLLENG